MRHALRCSLLTAAMFCAATMALAQHDSKPAMMAEAKPATQSAPMAHGVAASAQEVTPIKVGESVPAVSVRDSKGTAVSVAEAAKAKPTVIVFYRGGWCPYCNAHLAELAKIQPALAQSGANLVAISPDSPETLAAYEAEHSLPFKLMSDASHDAAKAFGIAFAVDAPTQEKLKGYGIDLAKASGNSEQVLPVPSVFVVKDGKVTYAHSNADYTKRLSGEEVLAALGARAVEAGTDSKPAMGAK